MTDDTRIPTALLTSAQRATISSMQLRSPEARFYVELDRPDTEPTEHGPAVLLARQPAPDGSGRDLTPTLIWVNPDGTVLTTTLLEF